MLGSFRVIVTFDRPQDGRTVESPFSHSFQHLSECLIWKAGLEAIYPTDRITILDRDGYAVPQATQDAFLRNM